MSEGLQNVVQGANIQVLLQAIMISLILSSIHGLGKESIHETEDMVESGGEENGVKVLDHPNGILHLFG